MKVCPKCHSTYTDETLNFCLTDGIPLVVEEVFTENLSGSHQSWHDAETLVSSRVVKPDNPHRTSPISTPSTNLYDPNETADFTNQKRNFVPVMIGAILAVALIGGGFWWYSNRSTSSLKYTQIQNTASASKRKIVQLSPEQETATKKEVSEFMEDWRTSNERKDIDAHIAHYLNTLEIFYDKSGVDRNIVRADRLRAYQRYDSISMQIDNLKITPESTESATVVFDKSWTMKNAQKTSTGSVEQEMHLSKIDGQWLIDSEKDLKVYFINNRENPVAENSSGPNQPADSKNVSEPDKAVP